MQITWNEVRLTDKLLFDSYIGKSMGEASEISFTNFFMWKDKNNIRFAEIDGFLCALNLENPEEAYAYPPLGEGDKISEKVSGAIKETMVSFNITDVIRNITAISKERCANGFTVLPWCCFDGVTISGG